MRDLPFIDGINHYNQSLANKKWDVCTLNIAANDGRFGEHSFNGGPFFSGNCVITLNPASRAQNMTFGIAIRVDTGFIEGVIVFKFTDVNSSGTQAYVGVTADGRLYWNVDRFAAGSGFRKSSSITGKSLHNGAYYLIEGDINIHGADPAPSHVDGNIWVDNENVLSFTSEPWGQAVPVLTPVKLDRCQIEATRNVAYCDIYVANGYHPNSRVVRLKPNSDNTINWQTPSVGTHFSKVDEDITDTSDFIATTRTGDIDDFNTEDLPSNIIAAGPELVQNIFYGHGQDRIIHRFNALEQDGVYDVFSLWCRGGINTATVNGATQGVKVDV